MILLVNVDQCPNKLTTQVPVTVPMSGPAQRCPSVMLTPYFREYSREQSDVLPTRNTACNQGVKHDTDNKNNYLAVMPLGY